MQPNPLQPTLRGSGRTPLVTLLAFALVAALATFTASAAPAPDHHAAAEAEKEGHHAGHRRGQHARRHGEPLTEEQRAAMKERAEARAAARFAAVASRLDLTEAQQDEWKEVMEAHHERRRADRETFGDLNRQLREELEAENPDTNRIGELTLALREHREVAKQSREELNAELRSLLTPEQAEKFDQMQARRGERGPRHGPRRHRRPGGGHPGHS